MRSAVLGLHHLRLPVTDVMCSADWYATVFGFQPTLILEEEDRVVGVVLIHDGGPTIGLHHAPELARSLAGFCLVALDVGDCDALDGWCVHLDAMGVEHTGPADGHLGQYVDVADPDGLLIQLHTSGQPAADEA